MPNSLEDFLKAKAVANAGISAAKKNDWMASDLSSLTLLMAEKHQNRFEKGKAFNGFVLEQCSADDEDNDFMTFLSLLSEQLQLIPTPTRFSLAVLTTYQDPDFDTDIEPCSNPAHWTAVDIWIGPNQQVCSFVLDAANSVGFRKMHADLKRVFPDGNHYIYYADLYLAGLKSDTIEPPIRRRAIQTQGIGCRIFTIEHLKQLSQIDPSLLYLQELSKIADANKTIIAANLIKDLKLTRIFRGMQSWTALDFLPADIKNTIIKDTSGETLIEGAKRFSEQRINKILERKNLSYKINKAKFVNSISDELGTEIMENREGYFFLIYPILLSVNAEIAKFNKEDFDTFVTRLYQAWGQLLPRLLTIVQVMLLTRAPSLMPHDLNLISLITPTIEKLNKLHEAAPEKLGHAKLTLIYELATLFQRLHREGNTQIMQWGLSKFLRELLTEITAKSQPRPPANATAPTQ